MHTSRRCSPKRAATENDAPAERGSVQARTGVLSIGPGTISLSAKAGQRMNGFIPGLGYRFLTPLYDTLVGLTLPEMEFKSELIRQAAIERNHRVGDIGCGTGHLLHLLKRKHPECSAASYDADPKMLSVAASKTSSGSAPVDWVLVDAGEPLPIPDHSLDRVFSTLLLHHLRDAEKRSVLLEIRRVLKLGGSFHLADWVRPVMPHEWTGFLGVRLLDGFENTRAHASGELPQMVKTAGFNSVEETGDYSTLFGRLRLFRAC